MNTLTILSNKGHCSVQDLGRFNSQHLGFSASGVADEYAYRYGNALLGNQPSDAALEIVFGHITIQANAQCTVVLTGTDCQANINQKSVSNWQVLMLKTGDVLTLKQAIKGNYTYLCVYGGINTTQFMHSRSQFPIVAQSPIQAETTIPLAENCTYHSDDKQRKISTNPAHFYSSQPLTLRFMPHKLWQELPPQQQISIRQQQYKISPQSNKMGIRLLGANMPVPSSEEMLSVPVTFGTIQLPASGLPIILMKDRQTIGGYPTLGCVLQTDLFRLAQMPAMQTVSFSPISVTQAQTQLQSFYEKFNLT